MPIRLLLPIVLLATSLACHSTSPSSPRWYKGNLHAHSLWSDGDEFPEVVAEWYKSHGYHFLAISDHNVFQKGNRWLDLPALKKKNAQPALDNYLARILWPPQTRGRRSDDSFAVRLRTFDEMRVRLDSPGRFLLIPAEEISDTFAKLPIHLNGFNLAKTIPPQHGSSISNTINNNVAAVLAHAQSLDRPTLVTVNHPNFGYALAAVHLAESDSPFFEVYNAHPSVNHLGNKTHPSVEKLWDLANTIRIAHLRRPPLLATACDDAHNYQQVALNKANPGRAWVMVRAKDLSTPSILAAITAGDFYASSGITLNDIRTSSTTIQLDIAADDGAVFTTHFIGTLANPALAATSSLPKSIDPHRIGAILATVVGPHPAYTLKGNELYVRAVVTSSKPPARPAYPAQLKQAWTQSFGFSKWLPPAPPP